jgi:hypothetical protein
VEVSKVLPFILSHHSPIALHRSLTSFTSFISALLSFGHCRHDYLHIPSKHGKSRAIAAARSETLAALKPISRP